MGCRLDIASIKSRKLANTILNVLNEEGFSLIELMIAVLIIGILVAVAIPMFSSTAESSKDTICITNLRAIAGALAQYSAEHNSTATYDQLINAYFLKNPPTDPHQGGGVATIDAGTGVVSIGTGHNATQRNGDAWPTF